MWASFRVLTLSPLSVKSMQPYSDPFLLLALPIFLLSSSLTFADRPHLPSFHLPLSDELTTIVTFSENLSYLWKFWIGYICRSLSICVSNSWISSVPKQQLHFFFQPIHRGHVQRRITRAFRVPNTWIST